MAKTKLQGLNRERRRVWAEIDARIDAAAALVDEYSIRAVRKMKALVPSDAADLRGSIRRAFAKTADVAQALITAGTTLEEPDVAAFVEFGTGSKVKVSAGLEDYAMTFYRTGTGRLPPNPYFFPVIEELRKPFLRDLQTVADTGKMP